MVLVVGSYIVWSTCALLISFMADAPFGLSNLQVLMPLASLVLLGFCLKRIDFGADQKRYADDEQQGSFAAVVKSVREPVLATLALSFLFGAIMQVDVVQGYSGYLVSPEAQVGSIALSVALLVYVLRDVRAGMRLPLRAVVFVALMLATVLMARAALESQTFFTSGVPLALFNFFGQLVWIVFVWKGYESKANSFSIVALGLGSMRLGLLLSRGLVIGVSETVGISATTANLISIVGLWVLFVGVLGAVWLVVRRQTIETTPFEPSDGGAGEAPSATSSPDEAATAQDAFGEKFAEAVHVAGLTEREQEVLKMYASGRSAVYIADELYLSNYTVKTHLRRCYAKLGVHSRQELLDLIWKGQYPPRDRGAKPLNSLLPAKTEEYSLLCYRCVAANRPFGGTRPPRRAPMLRAVLDAAVLNRTAAERGNERHWPPDGWGYREKGGSNGTGP